MFYYDFIVLIAGKFWGACVTIMEILRKLSYIAIPYAFKVGKLDTIRNLYLIIH